MRVFVFFFWFFLVVIFSVVVWVFNIVNLFNPVSLKEMVLGGRGSNVPLKFSIREKKSGAGAPLKSFPNLRGLDVVELAAVDRLVAEFLFDAEELVVLGDAVGAAH